MNRLKFILKFIVSKQNTGKYNWNLLFPFAGVIIGCFTVALTLAVMEGMEHAIFTKLENISFPGKLMNINSIITEELEDYLEGIKKPNGLILISGPTGSGKTTTLYATLKILNKEESNILELGV